MGRKVTIRITCPLCEGDGTAHYSTTPIQLGPCTRCYSGKHEPGKARGTGKVVIEVREKDLGRYPGYVLVSKR